MEIDNSEIIKKLIGNCEPGEFYMLQILHRSKDGKTPYEPKDKKISQQTIKTYYISSPEYLDYKMPEIKDMCKMFNARAYINLNKKSWKQISLKSLEVLASIINHEEWSSSKSIIDSACGQTGACDKNKTWIVDVDTKENSEVEKIIDAMEQCEPTGVEKFVALIPTLHGYHIIARPFNKDKFRKLYTNQIDLHDNNPTLLYFKERIIKPKMIYIDDWCIDPNSFGGLYNGPRHDLAFEDNIMAGLYDNLMKPEVLSYYKDYFTKYSNK